MTKCVSPRRAGCVIHHDAILAQHQAVPCPANRQFGKTIAIDAVQKHCPSAPCTSILPSVVTSHAIAGVLPALPGQRIDATRFRPPVKPLGAHPHANLNKDGPKFTGPFMRWGQTHRPEGLVTRTAAKRANCCWCEVGDRWWYQPWDRLAGDLCHHRKASNV